jgi:DNA polymerase-3 subunit epsilon
MTALLDTNIWDVPTAVVDFETTGLSAAGGDRVVEIAIVRANGARDSNPETYTALINPGMAMPPRAQRVHGISDSMVSESASFGETIDHFRGLLDGAIFVAHNARFDVTFLHSECDQAGVSPPEYGQVVDTLGLARTVFGFPKCGLSALAERMQQPLHSHHRALADATATFGIYQQMLESIDPDHALTVRDLASHIDSMRRGGKDRIAMKSFFKQAALKKLTVEIDYTKVAGEGGLTTTRQITVNALRPPHVQAWCHLRQQERKFRLERIQRATLPN